MEQYRLTYLQPKYGNGLQQPIYIPADFDQSLDQLELCAASHQAGNSGERYEILAILDTIKKIGFINNKEYKQIRRKLLQKMVNIKKGYKRKYIVGGCGQFDTIANLVGRMFFLFYRKDKLTLVRDSDAYAVLRAALADPAKIVLRELSWFVPHEIPSDENKMKLYKTIQSKTKLNCGFRMRHCDSIFVPQSREFTWRLSAKSGREKP